MRHRLKACAAALALTAWAGCQAPDRAPAEPLQSIWERPTAEKPPVPAARENTGPPTTAPAAVSPAGDGAAIARVNGESIARSTLLDVLLESHGVDLLEKLIVTATLRQQAGKLGIRISESDIRWEHDDALRRIVTPLTTLGGTTTMPGAGDFDREAAERTLDEFLAAKNISRAEFRMRMEQNAYLRKLAEREVRVEDSLLADEYRRVYGEKVQARCIQLSSPDAVKRVRAALEEGKDFELLARTMSENRFLAAQGGLLPPFTRYDDVPKLLRDAAFALKPGEISSTIHENNTFYILRIERRFPPSQVGVENVKDDLRRRIRDRLVRRRMDEMAGELFRAAAIEIDDPSLREAFRQRYPDINVGGR